MSALPSVWFAQNTSVHHQTKRPPVSRAGGKNTDGLNRPQIPQRDTPSPHISLTHVPIDMLDWRRGVEVACSGEMGRGYHLPAASCPQAEPTKLEGSRCCTAGARTTRRTCTCQFDVYNHHPSSRSQKSTTRCVLLIIYVDRLPML